MRSNKLDLYARITISKLFDKNTFFVYFNNVNGEIKPQYNLREFQATEKQKKNDFCKNQRNLYLFRLYFFIKSTIYVECNIYT